MFKSQLYKKLKEYKEDNEYLTKKIRKLAEDLDAQDQKHYEEIKELKRKLPLSELSLNDLRGKAVKEYGIDTAGLTKSDIILEIQCEQLDLKKIAK